LKKITGTTFSNSYSRSHKISWKTHYCRKCHQIYYLQIGYYNFKYFFLFSFFLKQKSNKSINIIGSFPESDIFARFSKYQNSLRGVHDIFSEFEKFIQISPETIRVSDVQHLRATLKTEKPSELLNKLLDRKLTTSLRQHLIRSCKLQSQLFFFFEIFPHSN